MALAIVSVAAQMVAITAVSGWLSQSPSRGAHATMASALMNNIACSQTPHAKSASCPTAAPKVVAAGDAVAHVVVPSGAAQCPASGAGAACGNRSPVAERGTPLLPGSMPACPSDNGKPDLGVPGACLGSDAGTTPAPASRAVGAQATIGLTADKTLLGYGAAVTLEAIASVNVTGTAYSIEIFDRTTGDLVGACAQASTCLVAYAGKSGAHAFAAFVSTPTSTIPKSDLLAASPDIDVQWLGIGLVAGNPAVAAPGQPITFTAFSSVEVGGIGYVIQFHDAATGKLITFCAQGTTCSTSVIEPNGGVYAVIASLVTKDAANAATAVTTVSGPVGGTWLAVQLNASAVTSSSGSAQLTANANADLSSTPWSIYIFNSAGAAIGQPCHAAACTATVPYSAGDNTSYYAEIARALSPPAPSGPAGKILRSAGVGTPRLDVVVKSASARPVRVLWGVDSCKTSTDDPNGSTGLYPQVISAFGGAPDFWGRYLTNTDNCPGLTPAEMMSAKRHHMGILPIYNDYDCSNYIGYATGMGYAKAAVAAAEGRGITSGNGIAIDIEPPGGACPGAWFVDSSFIEAWYDGITQAHFVPIYYGDTTAGSAFAKGWCGAVAAHPEYATTAFLWSFEPSLIGSWSKASAPGFAPNGVGCGGDNSAWQYSLSAGSTPDVDTDEALSRLPLWFQS